MSPGLTISLHWWRGIGADTQRDLFYWQRYRLGFLTLSVERTDVLSAYRKLRTAIERAVDQANVEGR